MRHNASSVYITGEQPSALCEHSMSQFSKSLLAFRDRPIVFGKRAAVAVAREVIAHDMTRKCRTEIVDRVAAYKLEGSLDFLARTA